MTTATIDVGNVSVEMVIEGDAIMRMMSHGKLWEPATRGSWRALIDPDKVVIDVGAYTGVYSIASALMGAKVIALEPHPPNYARLKLNAALNSTRIAMHPIAASSEFLPMMLRMKKPIAAISDTASLEVSDPATHTEPVHAVPIDSLNIGREVGLIKIDVEGHELRVLKGMRVTLAKYMPTVMVECLTHEAIRSVTHFMVSNGYRHQCILDNRNHLFIHTYNQ